jgi:hypothetical protein
MAERKNVARTDPACRRCIGKFARTRGSLRSRGTGSGRRGSTDSRPGSGVHLPARPLARLVGARAGGGVRAPGDLRRLFPRRPGRGDDLPHGRCAGASRHRYRTTAASSRDAAARDARDLADLLRHAVQQRTDDPSVRRRGMGSLTRSRTFYRRALGTFPHTRPPRRPLLTADRPTCADLLLRPDFRRVCLVIPARTGRYRFDRRAHSLAETVRTLAPPRPEPLPLLGGHS